METPPDKRATAAARADRVGSVDDVPGSGARAVVRGARTVGVACAFLTVTVATGVLVGWAVGNQFLTSIVPGLVAMNPLTAVCFISCAAALTTCQIAAGSHRWLAAGLAIVVLACGLARLSEYVVGWGVSVDSVLFAAQLDAGAGPPNRMAPNTALNFCLMGAAIGALVAGRRKVTQFLSLSVSLTAFIVVIGYAYSVTSMVQVAAFIPMALPTALLFLAMSTAVLCATPEHGLIASITSRGPGGRIMRHMLPPLLLAPPLLGWLRLQGELAGLYAPAFGVAFFAAVMVVVGVTLTWATARVVDRSEVERRTFETTLQRMAQFDNLTGLPNRMLFEDRLRGALARAQRSGGMIALLFLDLDGFKGVNDTLGHEAGDQVLKESARRIEGSLRTVDTAARLGGDEFTIVLEQIRGAEDVEVVASRLLLRLNNPYSVAGEPVVLSASVGVSLFPRDSHTATELLAQADAAMYRAKRAGKNKVMFHGLREDTRDR